MFETPQLMASYWSERYQKGQTQWDAGTVTGPLKEYIDQLTDKDLKILIPGGGNGYEAEYLHNHGYTQVYLLDIAPEPLQNFLLRAPDFPKDHLLQQDFFSDSTQTYDLILEQTFFCALPRSLRFGYAHQMFKLLRPKGKVAGVLFSEELQVEGPPFGGTAMEYQAYFEPYFSFRHFAACYNSIKPRAGRELFMVLERREKAQFIA